MKLSLQINPCSRLWPWFILASTIVGLDQATKIFAEIYLGLHQPQALLPLLNLTLVYNPGAAFSFLSQAGGWQRWFFIALSLSISAILAVWLTKLKPHEVWTRLALSLILAGAVGNLIDRVLYGHVIDFLDFFYPATNGCLPLFVPSAADTCHWPTFNVADSSISVGAVLLLLSQFFEKEPAPNNH